VILGSFCLVLVLAAPVFISACAEAGPTAEKPVEFTAQPLHPGSQMLLEEWSKLVDEQSGGRIKVSVFPPNTFAPQPDLYDAIIDDLVDIGTMQMALMPGRFPRYDAAELPLKPWHEVPESKAYVHQWMFDEGYLDEDIKDVKQLFCMSMGPEVPQTKVPVRTIEDMKGLRIRWFGTIPMQVLEALGATPVLMPVGEVYLSAEKGIIDGLVHPIYEIPTFKWHEVTDYTTDIALYCVTFPVMMNAEKWDALPADLKKVMEDAGGIPETMRLQDILRQSYIGPNLKWVEENLPGRIITLSPAELEQWQQAVEPVWESWLADMAAMGLPGQELVDAAHSAYEAYKTEYMK